jgi:hypothetical protein
MMLENESEAGFLRFGEVIDATRRHAAMLGINRDVHTCLMARAMLRAEAAPLKCAIAQRARCRKSQPDGAFPRSRRAWWQRQCLCFHRPECTKNTISPGTTACLFSLSAVYIDI